MTKKDFENLIKEKPNWKGKYIIRLPYKKTEEEIQNQNQNFSIETNSKSIYCQKLK
jgi:hypothetical protein